MSDDTTTSFEARARARQAARLAGVGAGAPTGDRVYKLGLALREMERRQEDLPVLDEEAVDLLLSNGAEPESLLTALARQQARRAERTGNLQLGAASRRSASSALVSYGPLSALVRMALSRAP